MAMKQEQPKRTTDEQTIDPENPRDSIGEVVFCFELHSLLAEAVDVRPATDVLEDDEISGPNKSCVEDAPEEMAIVFDSLLSDEKDAVHVDGLRHLQDDGMLHVIRDDVLEDADEVVSRLAFLGMQYCESRNSIPEMVNAETYPELRAALNYGLETEL